MAVAPAAWDQLHSERSPKITRHDKFQKNFLWGFSSLGIFFSFFSKLLFGFPNFSEFFPIWRSESVNPRKPPVFNGDLLLLAWLPSSCLQTAGKIWPYWAPSEGHLLRHIICIYNYLYVTKIIRYFFSMQTYMCWISQAVSHDSFLV